ncbi:MAG: enoyl-CoA hydratase/isomerase family protein [Ichthyobacteriaceae bacterium]|nr:enoyl-CoA hydratase/isomerase family protein [Ichthyobacteriaceae bacterium]
MEGFVKQYIEESSKVGIIEFYHPKGNSLPSNLLLELTNAIKKLGADNNCKVILVKSKGDGAFCAGASFNELLLIDNKVDGKLFFTGFANVINAIRNVPKFVIGQVQGKTVGGGVGLASAFDYCFATENASVKLSELSIGIGPFVIAPAVERKIGVSALAELTIDAQNWKSAEWAQLKGLFNGVYSDKQSMEKAVDVLVNSLSGYSVNAMVEMKKMLWVGTENWDELLNNNAEITGNLVLLDFTKNALSKFKNK